MQDIQDEVIPSKKNKKKRLWAETAPLTSVECN